MECGGKAPRRPRFGSPWHETDPLVAREPQAKAVSTLDSLCPELYKYPKVCAESARIVSPGQVSVALGNRPPTIPAP
jgi:hypothetical protein